MDKFEVKLDQAARAAWMSYVGGMTQDQDLLDIRLYTQIRQLQV
tara:strand:+ start:487 stop:618 length:132 start_codon:yes stop_codon:yes gene_type:complete